MSKPSKLPPIYTVDELDYEKMVEYKVRIFETIFPKETLVNYKILNEILKDVHEIYDNLTKIEKEDAKPETIK